MTIFEWTLIEFTGQLMLFVTYVSSTFSDVDLSWNFNAMPRCDGLPTGPCRGKWNDNNVKLADGRFDAVSFVWCRMPSTVYWTTESKTGEWNEEDESSIGARSVIKW